MGEYDVRKREMRELYERLGAKCRSVALIDSSRPLAEKIRVWGCHYGDLKYIPISQEGEEDYEELPPNDMGIKMAQNLIWTLEQTAESCEKMLANGDPDENGLRREMMNARRNEAEKYRALLREVGVEIPRQIE